MNANLCLGEEMADLLARASAGDLLSQRSLAEINLQARSEAAEGNGSSDLAAFEALLWARLAAAHGDEDDAMRLVAALMYVGEVLGQSGRGGIAHGLVSEAIAVLRALASCGYEPAVRATNDSIGEMAPTVISQSSRLMEALRG